MNQKLEEYLKQMKENEKKAYEIAKKQLGTSFNLEKSIGFIAYLKNNP
jgi:hypothetical protein|tara:strand:- start:1432 stop:1575 length:144 start_codon:yes stop_codon:yes gene_type:complete